MTESEPRSLTGIVLAGGRSSRFGSDKLVARVDGERLLDRSVAALAGLATDIVIVSEPGASRAVPAWNGPPVHLVEDPESYGGPLVGLLAGLEAASEPLVLVAGGDMPSMKPAVLALLVETLRADPNHTAAVLTSRGRVVPLPAALRTGAASDMARRLVGDGERRLRTLVERLRPIVLDEAEWRPLDPEGTTLRDVDRPEDLPGA